MKSRVLLKTRLLFCLKDEDTQSSWSYALHAARNPKKPNKQENKAIAVLVALSQNRQEANDSKSKQTHTAISTMVRRDKFIIDSPFLRRTMQSLSGGQTICQLRKLLH